MTLNLHTGIGEELHALAARLFPICRSITGDGVRQSLAVLGEHLPGLECVEVPSGSKCFDWTIPPEWNIRDAWVIDPKDTKIIDFQDCNLHVVGYSQPVDITMSLEELQPHLHSLPEAPDAVPYVTSYYGETWGICLSQQQRDKLEPGKYHVRIDSTLEPGSLTYGELVLPGEIDEEVFFQPIFAILPWVTTSYQAQ